MTPRKAIHPTISFQGIPLQFSQPPGLGDSLSHQQEKGGVGSKLVNPNATPGYYSTEGFFKAPGFPFLGENVIFSEAVSILPKTHS